jgi:hypothetical protein
MLSRSLALLFIPALPFVPLIAPFGTAHTANAIVAGAIATVLAVFSLVDNRARVAVSIVGAWVALAPFIFDSTLLEKVVTCSWGVSTFLLMVGPFSEAPRVSVVAPSTVTARPQTGPDTDPDDGLPLAA